MAAARERDASRRRRTGLSRDAGLIDLWRRVHPHSEESARRQRNILALLSRPSCRRRQSSTPSNAPFMPPMTPPMMAPTADPAPMRPTSPLIPELSIASVTVPRIAIVSPVADRDLIEADGEAALPIGARRTIDRRHQAAHHRAGRYQHAIPFIEIDDRRRLESILDLRGVRRQLGLNSDVDLLPSRNPATRSSGCCSRGRSS